MKIWQVELVEQDSSVNGLVARAAETSHQSMRIFKDVLLLKHRDGLAIPVLYGKSAIMLQSDVGNILLGYYDSTDLHNRTKTIISNGDEYLKAGESRAIRTSKDGQIQICNVFVKDNGEIVFSPIVSYDDKNMLDIKLDSLVVDMFGANAGGNIAWSQDKELGFNTFIENYKGNNKDVGPRMNHKIEGGPTGMTFEYIWDVTPGPIGGALPALLDTLLPMNMRLDMKGGKPFNLSYNLGPVAQTEISIDAQNNLKIKHITGAEMVIDTLGNVTVQSTGGLASIKMSLTGEVTIDGALDVAINGLTGVDMYGVNQSLLDVVKDIALAAATHIHPTGTGPSGPPVQAASFTEAAATATVIKGTA